MMCCRILCSGYRHLCSGACVTGWRRCFCFFAHTVSSRLTRTTRRKRAVRVFYFHLRQHHLLFLPMQPCGTTTLYSKRQYCCCASQTLRTVLLLALPPALKLFWSRSTVRLRASFSISAWRVCLPISCSLYSAWAASFLRRWHWPRGKSGQAELGLRTGPGKYPKFV